MGLDEESSIYVRADAGTLAGVQREQARATLQGSLPSPPAARTESHRMEDLPDHARRHYRLGQPGPCPLAWTRLGHGLYRANDTGRRTPPRGPLPRLARSMAEEARTIRLQAMAGFCLGQDRGDPGV